MPVWVELFIFLLFMRPTLVYNRSMERRRIGILGGTFDPIHRGHVAVAEYVREALALDAVLLLPAGDPPHKRCQASCENRLEMARIAVAGCAAGLSVSDMEVFREGKTYTVDTLRQLKRENPESKISFIIGLDTLSQLAGWREFAAVAGMCEFLVAGRPGTADDHARAELLKSRYSARVRFLDFSGPDVSSTYIRELAAVRASVRALVPEGVAEYIRARGLYLMSMPEAEAVRRLEQTLSPGRFRHTLGVADTARRMAEIFGDDPAAARVAGLLHDAAKSMTLEQMQSLCAHSDGDAQERGSASLLHAVAGEILARRDFGVRDPEILRAIRTHTLGAAEMTRLQKIVFVADFVEPNRRPFDGLERARFFSERDLDRAVCICAELTRQDLAGRGVPSHPRMLRLLEKYGR